MPLWSGATASHRYGRKHVAPGWGDWAVPDFSTLSRRQKDLQSTHSGAEEAGCLHLLVDSTGIKMMGEGEWKVKKHGADYRRQWRGCIWV
jgi:hypothetical protein